MKPITILLCCLISLNAMIQAQDLKTALNLINSQQFEEAEKMLDELIKTDPSNGNLFYYYGDALLKDYLADTFSNSKDEFARKAESMFQAGIEKAPANVLNQIGMGAVTLLRSSDTTKADEFFKKAEAAIPIKGLKKKEVYPEFATILTNLAAAQMYGKVNRFQKAINLSERAKVLNPNDPNIYLTLGDVYIKMNDASNALVNYNQALNKDPKSPLPKIKIGNIYMRVPNLVAARPYFEDAKEIDSTFAPVYRSLGELWTMGGRHDLAKTYYYRYMQLSGNTVPAKIRYGNSLFRSKDYAGALGVVEEVLKVDNSRNYLNRIAGYSAYDMKPQDLDKAKMYMDFFFKNAKEENIIGRDYAYYGKILYKMAKGDSVMLDKAFENLNKAYSMDEGDRALLAEMGTDYYYAKRYQDAIRVLQLKAEKGWGDKPDPIMIARAYYNMGDFPKAQEAFTNIINNDPANIDARLWLARTATKMDPDLSQGLANPLFEQVINQVGTETDKYKNALQEAYDYFGSYNVLNKNYAEAIPWYDKMYNLDPNNKAWQLKSLQAKAVIYFSQKNYTQARDMYNQLLQVDPNNKDYQKAVADLTKVINAQH
jgi:tetratricopeptide (TPR) repeat protein